MLKIARVEQQVPGRTHFSSSTAGATAVTAPAGLQLRR